MKIIENDDRIRVANFLKDQISQLENISAALMDLAVDNRENALEFFEAAHLAQRSADAGHKQVDRLYREWMDVENGDD